MKDSQGVGMAKSSSQMRSVPLGCDSGMLQSPLDVPVWPAASGCSAVSMISRAGQGKRVFGGGCGGRLQRLRA